MIAPLVRLSPFALLLALPGCGGARGEAQQPLEPDPAIAAALAEPIMIDPDLATQNRGNAAIVIGSFDGDPAWTRDPDQIAADRTAAVRLAGGTLQAAPTATANGAGQTKTLAQFAATLPGADRCPNSLVQGFTWAAELPAATPIYPGGHVVQAAGTREACALRAVRYITAAESQDLFDFHYTLLVRAGYRVEREGGALVARNGKASARIAVASAPGGMSEVTLASAT